MVELRAAKEGEFKHWYSVGVSGAAMRRINWLM
jgi:hypothetical protein